MTSRSRIKIAILQSLDRMPASYPQSETALRAEINLSLSPSPGSLDVGLAIRELETLDLITSTVSILTGDRKYAITDAGRVQLGQI